MIDLARTLCVKAQRMAASVAVIMLATISLFSTSVDGFSYGGHDSGYSGGKGSGTACIVKVSPAWKKTTHFQPPFLM